MGKVTVLVVGISGNAGKPIVEELLKNKNLEVRALVQTLKPEDQNKLQLLESLKSQGLQLFQGTITNKDTIQEAVQGVDAAVSCVRGDEETLFKGQYNLIDALAEAKAKLIIPAGYGYYEKPLTAQDGEFFYKKLEINDYAESKGLKCVDLNIGLFYEFLPRIFQDPSSKAIKYYGDKNTNMLTTSLQDNARYVSAIVSKPERYQSLPRYFVASGRVSWAEIEKYAKELGHDVKLESAGSVEDIYNIYYKNYTTEPQNVMGWLMPNLKYLQCNPKMQPDYNDDHYLSEYGSATPFKEFMKSNPFN